MLVLHGCRSVVAAQCKVVTAAKVVGDGPVHAGADVRSGTSPGGPRYMHASTCQGAREDISRGQMCQDVSERTRQKVIPFVTVLTSPWAGHGERRIKVVNPCHCLIVIALPGARVNAGCRRVMIV